MTRHLCRATALMVLIFFALPAPADDEKKDAKPDPMKEIDKKEAEKTEKRTKNGVLRGRILSVDESKNVIDLELHIPVPRINEGAANALAQAQVNLQAAMIKRDAQGVANAQRSIAAESMKLYKLEDVKRKIQVSPVEDVKVRLANPPPQFDEKGKPKKYTKKELDEMKGPDPKLPGYQADFGDLKADQYVEVTLVKKKDAPKGTGTTKPSGKKDKEGENDPLAHLTPEVSMIIILGDGSGK
jgi:hypothetical protein